ncbi:protein-disulfide reductase DsbD domain-containing protein [Rhodobacter ferrooxidans]|nr:protein-disulfide reductase DsbD domain-containing protein [Rhodobacter sp. SW2]
MLNARLRPAALAALLALAPLAAAAEPQSDVLAAEILPGWRSAGGSHFAALHLQLAPDWKTYWRSPGEAGIPPEFDWTGSQNLKSVHLHWPRPQVFRLNGMQTIGYLRDLVLPIEVTAIDPGQPIHLRARIDLGVCHEICMPAVLDLAADLPAPGMPDASIKAALRSRPDTGREAGLTEITCDVEPIADGLRLTARVRLPATGGTEVVVLEPGQAQVWASEATSLRQGGALVASADLVATSGQPFALDRSAVVVTVLGSDRAVEIHGCPAP